MHRNPRTSLTCAMVWLLVLFGQVSLPAAQNTAARGDEAATVTLDTVVVTSTRSDVPILESPVAISMVPAGMIRRRPAQSMADLLRDLPGVEVADNTVPGMQRLRIRGEEARRTLVLIDGQEISDHSTFGPLFLIDPAMVERVEVVRGPHSTLYGSRASGGVVNIITRRGTGALVSGSVGATYAGATDGYRAHADVSGRTGALSYFVGASRSVDHDRRTPEGRLPDTETASSGVIGRFGWSAGAHEWTVLYDLHRLESEASTPDRLVDGLRISSFRMNLPRRDRDKVGLVYEARDLLPALDLVHVDVFAQSVDRRITQAIAGTLMPPTNPPRLYDYFNDDFDTIDTLGANVQTNWTLAEAHQVVAGFSWLRDSLDKTIHRTGTHTQGAESEPVELISEVEAGISTAAFYAQDRWALADRWQLTGGMRLYAVTSSLDKSNDPAMPTGRASDSHLVGNLGVMYLPGEHTSLRASWSQGYVYPTLLHLHTGSLFGQGNLTRPNPTLRPETSTNWEIGLRHGGRHWSLDLAAFLSLADGYIASVRASELPELGWSPRDNTYANLDKAVTHGVEVALSGRVRDAGPELYAVGTWIQREVEFRSFSTTQNGKPSWRGRVGLRQEGILANDSHWHLDAWLAAGGPSTRRTSRSVEEIDGWYTLNLAGGYRFGKDRRYWVGAEVLNIFDRSYRPGTDELIQPGRHINLSVRADF